MNPLKSVGGTILAGIVLAAIILFLLPGTRYVPGWEISLAVWLHVLSGITWIGLLYYFNFVQVPALGEAASDEGGPGGAGIAKYVAPRALWWFRWGALATWLTGATILHLKGMLHHAFTLGLMDDSGSPYPAMIGIGAWLGTIMLFNVWVLIWPNQKKVLGIVDATPEQVAKAKNIAFMASRSNTLMSIPMIMSMIGPGHGWLM
jgi:uncharacterized membrane protein